MSGDPGLYARSFADVYDDWYGDLDDPALLVDAYRERCEASALVLELGSGTGRLAIPLHNAGFRVLALDASAQMLATAPTGPLTIAADMARLPLANGSADAALVAYNTFFNLASRDQQQACFHELARVLNRDGIVAIEAFIAPVDSTGSVAEFGVSTREHPVRPGEQLAIVTGPDSANPEVIVGSHVELGTATVCRPWRLVYQSPAELDGCAEQAGMTLRERYANWDGDRFDTEGDRHVSWYTNS